MGDGLMAENKAPDKEKKPKASLDVRVPGESGLDVSFKNMELGDTVKIVAGGVVKSLNADEFGSNFSIELDEVKIETGEPAGEDEDKIEGLSWGDARAKLGL